MEGAGGDVDGAAPGNLAGAFFAPILTNPFFGAFFGGGGGGGPLLGPLANCDGPPIGDFFGGAAGAARAGGANFALLGCCGCVGYDGAVRDGGAIVPVLPLFMASTTL